MGLRGRRSRAFTAAVVAVALGVLALPQVAAADAGTGDRFRFWPLADTFVDQASPADSFGEALSFNASNSPKRITYLMFEATRLKGRIVNGVELRLVATEPGAVQGRVFKMKDKDWDESATWDTRPGKGKLVAEFGPETNEDGAIEISLPSSVVQGNGRVALAIDSTTSQNSFSAREGDDPPELIVGTKREPGRVLDGLSHVAHERVGSSDPTYYSNGHRLALTGKGRLLALHGRHGQGVQLAWRDPAAGWITDTRGDVDDGLLRGDSGTGDWPASIALAPDSTGKIHAWAVWAAPSIGLLAPRTVVEMRKLSQLDARRGPKVGPLVTPVSDHEPIESIGTARVDLAIEPTPDGGHRGIITWLAKTGATTYDQMTGWFTDLDSAQPQLHDVHALFTSGSARIATLESDEQGTRLLVRNPSGDLQLFTHSPQDDLDEWEERSSGVGLSTTPAAYPSATIVNSGDTVVAVPTGDGEITVQRWHAGGTVTTVRTLNGYREPTVTTNGRAVFMIAIRTSDGSVVSRKVTGKAAGKATDVVEIAPNKASAASFPNALRRADGRIRFVVRGVTSGTSRSSVLAFQRRL